MARKIWAQGDKIIFSDLNGNFLFGGTGADPALTSSSGTTTIACGSAYYFTKNYASIALTGTSVLTVSGVSTNGTILVLKSAGAVTLTSSATPAINLAGFGASANSNQGVSALAPWPTAAGGAQAGGGGTANQFGGVGGIAGMADIETLIQVGHAIPVMCGGSGGQGTHNGFFNSSYVAGGGGGGGTAVILASSITANTGTFVIAGGNGGQSTGTSNTAPSGGAGGGALYIECAGALNFTCQISVGGVGGTGNNNAVGGGDSGGNSRTGGTGTGGKPSDQPSSTNSAAAGGGSGALGAANGSGGSGNGAGGASGSYYVGLNTVFT